MILYTRDSYYGGTVHVVENIYVPSPSESACVTTYCGKSLQGLVHQTSESNFRRFASFLCPSCAPAIGEV